MGIYVCPDLDQDQRICRTISFYDLAELITFGALVFDQSAMIRYAPRGSDSMPAKVVGSDPIWGPTPDDPTPATALGSGPAWGLTPTPSADVMYQTWSLFDDEPAIDWSRDEASNPAIHIVSTVGSLSTSLFADEDTEIFIDRTSGLVNAKASPQTASGLVPIFDDGTLRIIAWPCERSITSGQPLALRMPVHLKALLDAVIVSPKAPIRFVELVSAMVHRISHAMVARGNWSVAA